MKINISLFIIAILLYNLLPAQNISLFNQLNGHLDYTAIGNTLNKSENNGSSSCKINTDSSATLNLSPTQTVEAAYLYWAGSGSGDFNVTLNTTEITSSRNFAYSVGTRRHFFAAFADVTTLIQSQGNGLYTFSDLDIVNVSSPNCSPSTNFAGWAITIIYSDPALPFSQLNVYDGLETVPRSITIQLDNLNVIDTTGAKVGFIAWEGDAGLAFNEVLQINGITLSNRPLNPANNAFNGTNSFTNDSNLYNMDIDVYSIENAINAGDTSAVIQLTSGQDLVMVNNIITVLNSQLPDASVTIDSVDQRCNPRELTIEYTVRNLNSMRLLPANTPIAFYVDTVLVAQAQTTNDIPVDGTESNTITFTSDPLLLDPINLTIVVDDNGLGTGIISEISETNNTAFTSIVADPLPIANQPPDLEDCDDNLDGELKFDITPQTALILGNQNPSNFTVSYYENMRDAESGNSPLELTPTVVYTKSIVAKIVNNTTQCVNYTSFNLIVNPLPIVKQTHIITQCDTNYDGLTVFNIEDFEVEIFDVQQNFLVASYFDSLEALEIGAPEIQDVTAFQTTSNPQIIYIKVLNTATQCFTSAPLTLTSILPPAINPISEFEICHTDTNTFDLSEINSLLTTETQNITIRYFETLTNAENELDSITILNYQSITTPLFVRIQNIVTNCFHIHNFNFIANPLPIANQPPDLEDCDDNLDGELKFDITPQTALILGNQNPSNFTVSYYENMRDTESGNSPLELTPTVVYTKSIVAKIVNNTTRCVNYTSFNLIVNPLPTVKQTHIITQCDTNYDGLTVFNIEDFEVEIFDVQQNFLVASYFDSLEALEIGAPEIQDVTAFQTTSNPQIIYIKVLNTATQCFTSAPLTLTSILPPAINPISEFEICHTDTNTFDLSEINSLLTTETQNITIRYFETLTNAENELDSITILNYQSITTPLFVRIQNIVTNCFHIHNFNFIANPLPIANQPPDLEDCDDNLDGELKFDITPQTALILGNQNPSNFTVSYYENMRDTESGNSPLELTPTVVYTKSIVAKIVNNTTQCVNYTSFNLIVNPLPIVDIPKQLICLDNLPHYVSADTFNNGDTYLWSTGQTTNKISIDTTGTYSVTVTSPKGCITSSSFEASVSGAAEIEFTEVLNFTDPNSITVMVKGMGNYQYKLDNRPLQTSNFFDYVTLGYHTVTVLDLNGCSETTKEVLVINAQKFFTPNNDTYFDTWNIIGIETLPGSVIYIFDRYGKLLVNLNHDSGGWDGTYRGYEMPSNDYWFLAKIKTPSEEFEYKGHFALKR